MWAVWRCGAGESVSGVGSGRTPGRRDAGTQVMPAGDKPGLVPTPVQETAGRDTAAEVGCTVHPDMPRETHKCTIGESFAAPGSFIVRNKKDWFLRIGKRTVWEA